MTVQDLTENWTVGWNYLWQQAQALYAEKVISNPKAYEAHVAAFMQELRASRKHLEGMKVKLGLTGNRPEEVARFNRLSRQHYELASRFYSDTRPAQSTTLGFVPVLIVLGLSVGVAGTAWAISAWQYATNLREQTALAERELVARVAASQDGRTLQNSTLPAPVSASAEMLSGMGKLAVGGILLAAGLMFYSKHRDLK